MSFGLIQVSSVNPGPLPTSNAGFASTVTISSTPSIRSPVPTAPGEYVGLPVVVLWNSWPESSALFSKRHQPTRPAGAGTQVRAGRTVNVAFELNAEPAELATRTE